MEKYTCNKCKKEVSKNRFVIKCNVCSVCKRIENRTTILIDLKTKSILQQISKRENKTIVQIVKETFANDGK